jgi:hypothetical protein
VTQVRRNRNSDFEEDNDVILGDLETPDFDGAQERIEAKIRKEQKQQRTLADFVKDNCVC